MDRRRWRSIGLAGFAGTLVACNLIAGLSEDFTVAEGTTSPTEDSGNDAPSNQDGAADGPLGDGAQPDADADAQVGADFCTTIDSGTNGFCADFEDAGAAPFGWTSKTTDQDASIATVAGSGLNGSRGLEVYLQQADGGNNTAWLLVQRPGSKAANQYDHYELEFDFNVVEFSQLYSANLGMLTFPASGTNPREFGVGIYENGTLLSRLNTFEAGSAYPVPVWRHARVVLDRPDGGAVFTESVVITPDTVETLSNVQPGSSVSTEIRIGVFSTAAGAGSVRARFDNVVLRRW